MASLRDDPGVGGAALDQPDARRERVRFDRGTVVRTNVYVDAHDLAATDQRQEARVQDERTAVSHTGFHDDVRTGPPDHFLRPHEVFRELDDGASEPRESVAVSLGPADADPVAGQGGEGFRRVQIHVGTFSSTVSRPVSVSMTKRIELA
jgi:hypothetical protein